MTLTSKQWLTLALLIALTGGGGYVWWRNKPSPLPSGIVVANGRIEATQIDVATKLPGRVEDVLVKEGDVVAAGAVLARMDTATLRAERRQAEAQVAQTRNAVATASAVVAQRESELTLASNTLKRSEELVARGYISPQRLDADRSTMLSGRAALVAARSRVVEAESAVAAAAATLERIDSELADSALKAPRAGRVQYRLAEPGEVLPAGGKVVTMLDLTDVYMTVFLPETVAGKVPIGAEAHLVLDAAPQYVVPAKVAFVAAEAQFTPKTVETSAERQKLVFRVKVQMDPELLRKYQTRVKAGLPGVAYVRIDPNVAWPETLQVKLPAP